MTNAATGGQVPNCAINFIIAATTHRRVLGTNFDLCVLAKVQSWSKMSCILDWTDKYPYSPKHHAIVSNRTCELNKMDIWFGSCSNNVTYNSTAFCRNNISSSGLSFPVPSAIKFNKFWLVVVVTISPATCNNLVIVCMYHVLLGAYRSAMVQTRCVNCRFKNKSVVVDKKTINFSAMNSTLIGLVIRYNKSNVFRCNVSSLSSKQSMTANWCCVAYWGWFSTIKANPVTPKYFKLCDRLSINRAIASAAAFNKDVWG